MIKVNPTQGNQSEPFQKNLIRGGSALTGIRKWVRVSERYNCEGNWRNRGFRLKQ